MAKLTSTECSAWKKIQYKKGELRCDFTDVEGKVISVKGSEVPHPDFRTKFHSLGAYIKVITKVDAELIVPISIVYPEQGKVQFTARVKTQYTYFDIKTDVFSFSRIHEWEEDWQKIDVSLVEHSLVDVLQDINDEARLYLFEDKTAQAEIQFAN